MNETKTALLCAGGTGGHLFPAHALAQELSAREWIVHLATDERAFKFASGFPAQSTTLIPSATFGDRSIKGLMSTGSKLLKGYLASRKLIRSVEPDIVVGFGGYPTLPPLLAASHRGLKTVVHEQNAIMGRANKFLASRVDAIAMGFELVGTSGADKTPVTVTGNPLRKASQLASRIPFEKPDEHGIFRLVVFGGSQGARFFSEILPEALSQLSVDRASRLRVTLQAREEDSGMVRGQLVGLDIAADVETFFGNMPELIAAAHLVICRAGASSVAELSAIGRPSILVPFPSALDDDQGANAKRLQEAGGAILVRQKDLSAERLADMIRDAMDNPDKLAIAAQSAKKAAIPNAAMKLADLVEQQFQD